MTQRRLHVLGLAFTETTDDWPACAYTQRTRDFCSYMTDVGVHVTLYAGEQNQARCAEHVPLVTRAEQAVWFPGLNSKGNFAGSWDASSRGWHEFNLRAVKALNARVRPRDIVCFTMGTSQQPIAAFLPEQVHVETGIGYKGVFAPYRVFESVAWRHFMAAREPNDHLRSFDAVIPRGYFTDDFPYGFGRGSFLYIGRLVGNKGPQIAAEVCQHLGVRLRVAGPGMKSHNRRRIVCEDGTILRGDLEYLGVLHGKEKADAMGAAPAVFMPTQFLEPGGGVAIEAQLCGTPVITTPWGAMTETVRHDVSGYHCAVFQDYVDAAQAAAVLDRSRIRHRARAQFGAIGVADRFMQYFDRLDTLFRKGWYETRGGKRAANIPDGSRSRKGLAVASRRSKT